MMNTGTIKNPKFASSSGDIIDVTMYIEGIGDAPYSCVKDHPTDKRSAKLYDEVISGKFGLVTPYEDKGRESRLFILSELERTEPKVKECIELLSAGLRIDMSMSEYQALVAYRYKLRRWEFGKPLPKLGK